MGLPPWSSRFYLFFVETHFFFLFPNFCRFSSHSHHFLPFFKLRAFALLSELLGLYRPAPFLTIMNWGHLDQRFAALWHVWRNCWQDRRQLRLRLKHLRVLGTFSASFINYMYSRIRSDLKELTWNGTSVSHYQSHPYFSNFPHRGKWTAGPSEFTKRFKFSAQIEQTASSTQKCESRMAKFFCSLITFFAISFKSANALAILVDNLAFL